MFLIKILPLLILNIKFVICYTRVSPVFSFNNTVSCGSIKFYNNFVKDCGISNVAPTINGNILNTRIINGENSRKLSWPWLVYLAEVKTGKIIEFRCSASLIHYQYVLTLSSCLNGINQNDLVAIIGLDEIKDVSDNNTVYNVSEIINYKQYNPNDGYLNPNLALVKLSRPVDNTTIKPICLPHSDDSSVVLSKTIVVASW